MQHLVRLHAARIIRYAFHRTYLSALRLVKVADALGALIGIDLVNLYARKNRVIWAFGLAHVTVDALIGNDQRHFVYLRLTLPGFFGQSSRHPGRHKLTGVAAQQRNLAHQCRQNRRLR